MRTQNFRQPIHNISLRPASIISPYWYFAKLSKTRESGPMLSCHSNHRCLLDHGRRNITADHRAKKMITTPVHKAHIINVR